MSCPSDNTNAVDQTSFWSSGTLNWDAHRIGWAISGGCAVLTVLIALINVINHARHYHIPSEQRQILRIIYMPPVYAIISFLSYRFFREFTYYDLVEEVYEAITISAFLLLIIEYVAATASNHDATKALERKDKRKLVFPLCFIRFRPTKPYFMYTLKWSVMQYVVIRPLVSIAGIICQAFNVLCENQGFSLKNFKFAYPYLEVVDALSITIALYGLIVFYALTHSELQGRRPLAKFLCIKLIVMFTFYQGFVFSLLQDRVIKPTDFWTSTNIADGLNALAICIEMVFFAALMLWAYPASEYKHLGEGTTSIWRPLWDSINYSDFAREIWASLIFFFDYLRGKPYTHSESFKAEGRRTDFGGAFGLDNDDSSASSSVQRVRGASKPYISTPVPYDNGGSGVAPVPAQRLNAGGNGKSGGYAGNGNGNGAGAARGGDREERWSGGSGESASPVDYAAGGRAGYGPVKGGRDDRGGRYSGGRAF